MRWLRLACPRGRSSLSDRPITGEAPGSARQNICRSPPCFAPPSLLSPEEEPMDIDTIYLTPHPKNENTDGEKGIAFTVVEMATVVSCTNKPPALTVNLVQSHVRQLVLQTFGLETKVSDKWTVKKVWREREKPGRQGGERSNTSFNCIPGSGGRSAPLLVLLLPQECATTPQRQL